MSVDMRTRVDGEVEAVDRRRAASRRCCRRRSSSTPISCAAPWRVFAPGPLVIDVDGDAWTLADDGGAVRVRAGAVDGPGAVLRLNRRRS